MKLFTLYEEYDFSLGLMGAQDSRLCLETADSLKTRKFSDNLIVIRKLFCPPLSFRSAYY